MRQQLTYAVRNTSAIGQSKHAEKKKGLGMKSVHHDGRSYSYSTLNSRLDTAKQFGNWMKKEHPEILFAKDVKADHMNEYLMEKAKSCRKATMESYASNLRALVKELEKTYHCEMQIDGNDIKTFMVEKDVSRTMPMEKEDMERLHASFKLDSAGDKAMRMEKATGCRVEGLTKLQGRDITILSDERAQVFVHGEKGGRERVVDVYGKENVENLAHVKDIVEPEQRICEMKPDSLNKLFNRHLKALNMKDKYPLTSVHSMRKTWAQEMYDRYRADHTKLETVRYVNKQLGHGEERDQILLDRYVKNCW